MAREIYVGTWGNGKGPLRLPSDAVTQTLGILAQKGRGKTYLAQLLAEGMLDLNAQVIAVDPVSKWWSLRVAANGRSKGKEIYVFGGHHGDLPLSPESGKLLGRVLAERRASAVLDLLFLRKAQRERFLADFAEEFLHAKQKEVTPAPVHVFLEEAQTVLPQAAHRMLGGDSLRNLGAWEDVVRLGRNAGIGVTLISQRAQSVNKEALSQVEALFALGMNEVAGRKVIEAWVQEKGEERSMVGELPGLKRGEAFLWSPSWLQHFYRVRVGTKSTFDASATPTVHGRRRGVKLGKLDMAKLGDALSEVTAKVSADDPSALRRRIHELERALAQKVPPKPVVHLREGKERKVEVLVLREREARRLEKVTAVTARSVERMHYVADSIAALVAARVDKIQREASLRLTADDVRPAALRVLPKPSVRSASPPAPSVGDAAPALKAGARTMLQVLAGADGTVLSRTALAVHSIIAQTGGTFSDYLSALASNGYVAKQADGTIALTPLGAKRAELLGGPLRRNATDLAGAWGTSGRLKAGARRMLAVLMSDPATDASAFSREQLAERAGIAGQGGTFSDYLSALRSAGLVEENVKMIRAASCLYLHGA